MSAIRLSSLALSTFLICHSLFAQVPSVQLKVKEKSGFLGIGPPRSVYLLLSNPNRQLPVTSENVNSGPYYYFLCRPVGDWKLDADIINEELSRLLISQQDQRSKIVWKGDLISDTSGTSVLLGFPKEIKLYEAFLFQIPLGDAVSQVEYVTPEEYWPGYSLITALGQHAEKLASDQQFKQAIDTYEQILLQPSLQIFPEYAQARQKRTELFDRYLTQTLGSFLSATVNPELSLKARLTQIDQYQPVFQYVADSLPKPSLQVEASSPEVQPILTRAQEALTRATDTRAALQKTLDEQNVRWIIEGSATGRTGYQYQYMIETLAYAFASMDYADTTRRTLKVTIPDEQRLRLEKYQMMESYETFLRMCGERFRQRLPLYPPDFLQNVSKDSLSFSLPFYAVLRAVQEYFEENFNTADQEILNVFRTSYDTDLCARMDQMRVLIDMRQRLVPLEVLKILDESKLAEARKNPEAALERYRQATTFAPDLAYASFALGKYYVEAGDPIRALTFFERAYQLDTLYLSAYREAYNLYRKGGNFKPMIEMLTRALQHGNNYWEINFNLAHAYMGDGDPARAVLYFEKALSLSPRSYQTNIQLGLAYQATKNFQKAREHFNRAIDIDPLRQEAVDFLNRLNELQKTVR